MVNVLFLIFLIPIVIILIISIVIFSIYKLITSGKRLKKILSEGGIPKELKEKAIKKLEKFQIISKDIKKSLKEISLFKESHIGILTTTNSKVTLALYPRLTMKNFLDTKRCLFALRVETRSAGLGINPDDWVTYTLVKLKNNSYLDITILNQLASVFFNEKICGYIDFKNKVILDEKKNNIGKFNKKDFNLINIGDFYDLSIKYPIYIKKRKIADLRVQPSTLEAYKDIIKDISKKKFPQIPILKNVNTKSKKENYILLAFVSIEYGILEIINLRRRLKGSSIKI